MAEGMRWKVTKAVRRSDLPAPARHVMLTLADVAEVGTAEIPAQHTPSLAVLARETGLNESTVKRHLNALEALGWLVRTRPTIEAARLHGERTRYRLTMPQGAESAVEGAEEAQEGAERATGGRTESPDPGRTRRPSKRSDPSQTTTRSKELVEPDRLDPNEPFDERQDTAQTIVGAWIDYCTARDVKLPKQLIGHYAKQIKTALDDGFTANQVKAALAAMLADAVANRPSLLPNRLVEMQTGPERRAAGTKSSTTDARVAEGLALADRLERMELTT